ncbi:HEAT repeat domain-containing protein [Streptomyces sp. TRM64462]|uniref:HEAT repeat domain-containing protein n=1 Tax=Streptomyces sp. TRM64462 TaxID=2741726 RepID=UPI0015865E40|nr:HEAT repeat domain-containing protein [Streptomyces sp. TRM64462]
MTQSIDARLKEGLVSLTPPPATRYNDPAEYLDFARPITEKFLPYDTRSDSELREVSEGHDSPLERERALWELADRSPEESLAFIADTIGTETDRSVRSGALWLALRSAGPRSLSTLEKYATDDDPEVADWARVLAGDITGVKPERVYNEAEVEETGYFDQTVPLIIGGRVVIMTPGVGAVRAVLSPLWFDSILGRVLASTNVETIRTDLTVEKALEGLNADGSCHYEIFPFRGLSVEYDGKNLEHNYLSETLRPFYPSGFVGKGEMVEVPVSLGRIALTSLAGKGEVAIHGDGPRAQRLRAADMPFVQSVRGRYYGWAAVNLDRTFDRGTVGAGDVQLSNPTDPIAGPMTNAKLYGTFRGKSGDYAGAGRYTLNSIKCHGRPDGRIDVVENGGELAAE